MTRGAAAARLRANARLPPGGGGRGDEGREHASELFVRARGHERFNLQNEKDGVLSRQRIANCG